MVRTLKVLRFYVPIFEPANHHAYRIFSKKFEWLVTFFIWMLRTGLSSLLLINNS